jgi:hypothetical protein
MLSKFLLSTILPTFSQGGKNEKVCAISLMQLTHGWEARFQCGSL